MSKGIWVASKASTAIAFVEYGQAPANGIPKVLRRIVVKGGANVSQPKTFVTPNAVLTNITQDDFDFLMKDQHFINFMSNGFMSVISDDQDVERVAKDMVKKDKSAPKTPDDYAGGGANIILGAAKAA